MLRESPNRAHIAPYFPEVGRRVQLVLDVAPVLERTDVAVIKASKVKELRTVQPPTVENWFQITDEELTSLDAFISRTQTLTSELGPEELKTTLNADSRFQQHLDLMDLYIEELCKNTQFLEFLLQRGITKNFLKALAKLHDFGRCIFNGPLPLKFVDAVSDAVLAEVLPSFPRNYLHSITWITEESPAPDLKDGKSLSISEMKPEHTVGLILKALDTLSKTDSKGILIDLDTFFNEAGVHKQWVQRQVDNHRLPFNLTATRIVTPEQYAANDERLTRKGAQVIQSLTGLPFAEIRNRVESLLITQ